LIAVSEQVEPSEPSEPSEPDGPDEVRRSALSRRLFLTRSSMTVVAAGVVSALPALPAVVTAAESEAPAAEGEVGEGASLTEPIFAQVKNLQTGEMSLYNGEREISILDRGLAARLFNAAK
jgi:hypothetical protein